MATADTQFKKRFAPWNKGKIGVQVSSRKGLKLPPLSDEHRLKIGLGNMGRTVSQETRDKIRLGNQGKIISKDTRIKMSLAKLGKVSPHKGIKRPEQSGVNNWKWIADRTQIKTGDRFLNDPLQKGWRKAVKDRDGWRCRIADVNCDGRLEAHHILPWSKFPKLRYQTNNGITLCHHHHPRKTAEVMELSPYFQQLVAEVN